MPGSDFDSALIGGTYGFVNQLGDLALVPGDLKVVGQGVNGEVLPSLRCLLLCPGQAPRPAAERNAVIAAAASSAP